MYDGQEAICVGTEAAITREDDWITTYRCHGVAISRGCTPTQVFAEQFGRAIGASRGKGGSMHLFDLEKHFYGGHGIVGASVPIGAGLAFADKYKGNNNVTYCYFGDGAAHQGQVYEAFNMAKIWNLPVLFIIEKTSELIINSNSENRPCPIKLNPPN